MPTARPIISANVGAVDDRVMTFDASSSPPMPTAMPTSAVSRFIPAASSEPKVSASTATATATPTNSMAPIVTPVVPKALPPTDLEPGVLGGVGGLRQGVETVGGEVLVRDVVLDGGQ